jgi:ATP adenylyltransferase
MDYLWSPWRYRYVSQAGPNDECIFCRALAENADEQNFILHRAERNFIILNRYPYTNGHLMVAPYEHVASPELAPEETLLEMMRLARASVALLREVYHPHGLNIGMNLGECAGAGVASHLHLHVLPRWTGDASFMTVTGETRVLPEDLPATFAKLKMGQTHFSLPPLL